MAYQAKLSGVSSATNLSTNLNTPLLFTPLALADCTLPNRVVVSPMCMYSSENQDGIANDFHLVHVGQFALGGAGLIIMEAAAVQPNGRISPQDLGLWSDAQVTPLEKICDFVHKHSQPQSAKIGIQLAHAGRKASMYSEWRGKGPVPQEQGGWQVVGPDANAYRQDRYAQPVGLTVEQIAAVVADFASATKRALVAGFDLLEIHAAHGYLLHQFMSPLSNSRTDQYGGSFENRVRLLLEVIKAVRASWPVDKPLSVRISATDYVEGGWNIEESIQLAKLLPELGVNLLDVSSGGLSPLQKISVGAGYQVPLAEQLRAAVPNLPVMTVGLISEAQQAETILQNSQADLVALGRPFLRDPHWPQRAASQLGHQPDLPPMYKRAGW